MKEETLKKLENNKPLARVIRTERTNDGALIITFDPFISIKDFEEIWETLRNY